jgi:hypothetical protein
MRERPELRLNPRLQLRYPIRIDDAEAPDGPVISRTVTQNLGARGAYFSTFHPDPYHVGQPVGVVVTVPHRLSAGGEEVLLDLRARGRIVRVDAPASHRRFGEDGLGISGVAVEFSSPLAFNYRWV